MTPVQNNAKRERDLVCITKFLSINLQKIYHFNATLLNTDYNGQMQSSTFIKNIEFGVVGEIYYADSHYCTLFRNPDNTIHEYDGRVQNGEVRQTSLITMPYIFNFTRKTGRRKPFKVELAIYIASNFN